MPATDETTRPDPAALPGSRAAFLAALAAAVGPAHVLTAAADVAPFARDWRDRYRGEVQAVVSPASTDEVAAVVRACALAGVPVVPQAGNTGLVGAAAPHGTSLAAGTAPVVLSLRRMNRIRDLDPVGNTLVVEAGCVIETVQRAASEAGRCYAVTWGAQGSAQVGGSLSTNAGGTGVLKYGSTRDQVLGLEVVLPDGRIWDGLRRLHKDNTGYALKHLSIGAEGTLGIVTAAALKLHPKPQVTACAWLTVDSVEAALEALAILRAIAGDRISAYELLNRAQLEALVAYGDGLRLPVDPLAPLAVLLELSDTYARADLDGLLEEALGELTGRGLLRDAAIAASIAQRERFWTLRHRITEVNPKAGYGLACDVAVPVGAVARFIDEASRAVLAAHPQATIVYVAHLGDGNVHFIPRFGHADWARFDAPQAIADGIRSRVNDVAVRHGGTFSAEHGIGHVLVGEMERLRSPLELELMRRVKTALDPAATMNPGKVLRG